ncbi:MAG: hypothetical protein Q8Q09_11115 [Deltaproteobacteria bacterium]|nr:hypothetical protein [Deltaproteobacteria bacterium]
MLKAVRRAVVIALPTSGHGPQRLALHRACLPHRACAVALRRALRFALRVTLRQTRPLGLLPSVKPINGDANLKQALALVRPD